MKKHKRTDTNGLNKFEPHMKHLIKYLNQCFQQGFSKNLEISRKGEWASPDPFSQKFSLVLKTPYKTLCF